jgi:hypothetical protein
MWWTAPAPGIECHRVIVADESHEGSRPDAGYHDRVRYRQERVPGSRDRCDRKGRKQLRRSQVLAFFKALPPCLIGMEACATAHYWGREVTKLGHRVRLMPARDAKAYVKRSIGKPATGPSAYLIACFWLGPISGSHQGQRPQRLHRNRGYPPSENRPIHGCTRALRRKSDLFPCTAGAVHTWP